MAIDAFDLVSSTSGLNIAMLPGMLTNTIPFYPMLRRFTTWIPLYRNRIVSDSEPLRALPCGLVDEGIIGEDKGWSTLEDLVADLEREVMGEAEEHTVCLLINRHCEQGDVVRSEVISALASVLRVSRREVTRAYERVKDGLWYRQTL
ncbi:hypothetical protein EON65_51410 [archaeon]|nr:MAG: hypothetical protein EON65_51410 [archaeon]